MERLPLQLPGCVSSKPWGTRREWSAAGERHYGQSIVHRSSQLTDPAEWCWSHTAAEAPTHWFPITRWVRQSCGGGQDGHFGALLLVAMCGWQHVGPASGSPAGVYLLLQSGLTAYGASPALSCGSNGRVQSRGDGALLDCSLTWWCRNRKSPQLHLTTSNAHGFRIVLAQIQWCMYIKTLCKNTDTLYKSNQTSKVYARNVY